MYNGYFSFLFGNDVYRNFSYEQNLKKNEFFIFNDT